MDNIISFCRFKPRNVTRRVKWKCWKMIYRVFQKCSQAVKIIFHIEIVSRKMLNKTFSFKMHNAQKDQETYSDFFYMKIVNTPPPFPPTVCRMMNLWKELNRVVNCVAVFGKLLTAKKYLSSLFMSYHLRKVTPSKKIYI